MVVAGTLSWLFGKEKNSEASKSDTPNESDPS